MFWSQWEVWLIGWVILFGNEIILTLSSCFGIFVSFVNQDIQVALRDEIKSACDYRPFEKCDYSSRVANEICCKKLEYVMSQLDAMKETMDEYRNAVWRSMADKLSLFSSAFHLFVSGFLKSNAFASI